MSYVIKRNMFDGGSSSSNIKASAFHGKVRGQTNTNTCYLFSLRDTAVILQRDHFVAQHVLFVL